MVRVEIISSVVLSLGLSLGFCVACGSSDGNGGNNAGAGPSSGAGGAGPSSGAGAGGAPHAGGAPSASGGAFTSTLPGDKPLNSLTDAEFAGLCQEFDADFGPDTASGKAAVEADCRLAGLFFAALSGGQTDAAVQAACKSGYDECIAAPTQSDPAQCTKPGASCTATVAEAEACFNDSIAAFATLRDALPMCSALTVASLSDGSSSPTSSEMTPPSCVTYQAKCPDAQLPGDSSSSN